MSMTMLVHYLRENEQKQNSALKQLIPKILSIVPASELFWGDSVYIQLTLKACSLYAVYSSCLLVLA